MLMINHCCSFCILFCISLLLSKKKTILTVSRIILFLFPSEHLATYTMYCIKHLFHREQVNRILCIFFDKVDQYRTCIQSNNSKKVGVAE